MKADVDSLKTPNSQESAISIQERSETQRRAASVSETAKPLGFTRSLFDVTFMEKMRFLRKTPKCAEPFSSRFFVQFWTPRSGRGGLAVCSPAL